MSPECVVVERTALVLMQKSRRERCLPASTVAGCRVCLRMKCVIQVCKPKNLLCIYVACWIQGKGSFLFCLTEKHFLSGSFLSLERLYSFTTKVALLLSWQCCWRRLCFGRLAHAFSSSHLEVHIFSFFLHSKVQTHKISSYYRLGEGETGEQTWESKRMHTWQFSQSIFIHRWHSDPECQ